MRLNLHNYLVVGSHSIRLFGWLNIWLPGLKRKAYLLPLRVQYLLFYYENRTQGTLKTIKKNKEQSTTG